MTSPSRIVLSTLRKKSDLTDGLNALEQILDAASGDPDAHSYATLMKEWFDAELGAGPKLSREDRRRALHWWEQNLDAVDALVTSSSGATSRKNGAWSIVQAVVGGGLVELGIEAMRRLSESSTEHDSQQPPHSYGKALSPPTTLNQWYANGPFRVAGRQSLFAHVLYYDGDDSIELNNVYEGYLVPRRNEVRREVAYQLPRGRIVTQGDPLVVFAEQAYHVSLAIETRLPLETRLAIPHSVMWATSSFDWNYEGWIGHWHRQHHHAGGRCIGAVGVEPPLDYPPLQRNLAGYLARLRS